jgi:hypothetical protein
MGQVLLFSFTAMANPTLLAATTVMLVLADPKKLMLGYLLGALMMSITLGLIIVFALQDADALDTAQRTVNPIADLAIGAVLLVIALVVGTGARKPPAPKKDKAEPRWKKAIDNGSARTTFVVGALLTLPGASYLAALAGIVKLDPPTIPTVLLVLMVNLIMLALVEVPLIGFVVAPDRTRARVERVRAWLGRNGRRAVVAGATVVGVLLIARGLITLLS